MSKGKEKKEAEKRETESYQIYKEDRESSRQQARELQGSKKERLAPYYDLQQRSKKFLDDAEAGKDVTELLDDELKFRNQASDRAKAGNRMYMNTGARALMGAPDANFQYQMDKEKELQEGEDYASQALNLYYNTKRQKQSDLLGATDAISGDDYNIANVLSGQVATSGNVWKGDRENLTEIKNRPSWFSKYVMPIATGVAGGITRRFIG